MSKGQMLKKGYQHPKTIAEFERIYRDEYQNELARYDQWIKWCEKQNDTHGVNFFQGARSAMNFNEIKMSQLIRILKQEPPNALDTK